MTALNERLQAARAELEAALPSSLDARPGIIGRKRQRRRAGSLGVLVSLLVVAAAVTFRVSTEGDGRRIVADGSGVTRTTAELPPGTAKPLPGGPLSARFDANAVWTGKEMLIWGGAEGAAGGEEPLGDGAAYDPRHNTWTVLPEAPLRARSNAAVVWTGKEMLIWGGSDAGRPLGDGAAYNPETHEWRLLSAAPIPGAIGPATVWTGREMLVVGGLGSPPVGAAYDSAEDRWRTIGGIPARAPHSPHAVMAGDRAVFQLETGIDDPRLFEYQAEGDRWAALPDPGMEVHALGSTNDALLAVSFTPGTPSRALRPNSGEWTSIAMTPGHSGTFTQGIPTPAGMAFWSPESAMTLDARNGRWVVDLYAPALRPRTNAATVWADGMVLVWGGRVNAADASGSVWTTAPLTGLRRLHPAQHRGPSVRRHSCAAPW